MQAGNLKIASALYGVTINRELRRDSRATKVWKGGYEPVRAQELAEVGDGGMDASWRERMRDCVGKSLRWDSRADRWSTGAGTWSRHHQPRVIDRFIYHRTAQKDYWHRLLPRHKLKKKKKKRAGGSAASFIKQRRSIAERPAEVEGRETSGYWEADCMLFARYGQGLMVIKSGKRASASCCTRSIEKLC